MGLSYFPTWGGSADWLVSCQQPRSFDSKCSPPLSGSTFASCREFNKLNELWRTAYTTFSNLRKLFTAFSSYCDIIKQLVSFTAINSTKQESVRELVSQSVSEWQALPMIGLGSDKNVFRCSQIFTHVLGCSLAIFWMFSRCFLDVL